MHVLATRLLTSSLEAKEYLRFIEKGPLALQLGHSPDRWQLPFQTPALNQGGKGSMPLAFRPSWVSHCFNRAMRSKEGTIVLSCEWHPYLLWSLSPQFTSFSLKQMSSGSCKETKNKFFSFSFLIFQFSHLTKRINHSHSPKEGRGSCCKGKGSQYR